MINKLQPFEKIGHAIKVTRLCYTPITNKSEMVENKRYSLFHN